MNIKKIAIFLTVLSIISFAVGRLILKPITQIYEINDEKTLAMEGITGLQIRSESEEVIAKPVIDKAEMPEPLNR